MKLLRAPRNNSPFLPATSPSRPPPPRSLNILLRHGMRARGSLITAPTAWHVRTRVTRRFPRISPMTYRAIFSQLCFRSLFHARRRVSDENCRCVVTSVRLGCDKTDKIQDMQCGRNADWFKFVTLPDKFKFFFRPWTRQGNFYRFFIAKNKSANRITLTCHVFEKIGL